MTLDSLFSVLLQTLSFMVDLHQWRKSRKNVLKLVLFLSQADLQFIEVQVHIVDGKLMVFFKLIDDCFIVRYSSCKLVLIVLINDVGMGKLLAKLFPIRAILFFYCGKETSEFIDYGFILCQSISWWRWLRHNGTLLKA